MCRVSCAPLLPRLGRLQELHQRGPSSSCGTSTAAGGRTSVADRLVAELVKPLLPHRQHLRLVQLWQVVRSAASPGSALVARPPPAEPAQQPARSAAAPPASRVAALVRRHPGCYTQRRLTRPARTPVEEGSVRPPAQQRAQGVAVVLGEADVLQLLGLVVDGEHRRLCAFWDARKDVALDSVKRCHVRLRLLSAGLPGAAPHLHVDQGGKLQLLQRGRPRRCLRCCGRGCVRPCRSLPALLLPARELPARPASLLRLLQRRRRCRWLLPGAVRGPPARSQA